MHALAYYLLHKVYDAFTLFVERNIDRIKVSIKLDTYECVTLVCSFRIQC